MFANVKEYINYGYGKPEETVNYAINGALWYSSFLKDERKNITFSEAIKRLTEIGKKYNLENQKNMPPEQLKNVQKMFIIIASSCGYLLNEVNIIEKNKLLLEAEEYISLDEVKTLLDYISLGVGLMNQPGKNYSAAIDVLISAAKIIKKIGKYDDELRVGLHGSIQISEI